MAETNTLKFVVPSGYEITIREQNGNDDDILSNATTAADGSSVANFLYGIILHMSNINKKPELDDIMKMKLRDKYVTIINSRIFSIGQILSFEYDWEDGNGPIAYEEDLGIFVWDYSKPFPKIGEEMYNPFRIQPYEENVLQRELTLSSGKKIRYEYANCYAEKYLLLLPESKQSKNQELIARNLSQMINNSWVKVENFTTFTTTEMKEMRADLDKYDLTINLVSIIKNPNNKNAIRRLPILANQNFFFPAGI